MQAYRLYYHESVWLALRGLGKREQAAILAIGRAIADNPFIEPDYAETDASGNSWSCILRNGWAVAYHSDHAVREIKIGHIHQADA